ncbi:FAD-binding protein [Legionella hackeliae]|uniref:FAD linked oxidase N-terminal domain-containing protein n=1 Tax=Legionella hackeliae TaxID=449 RepID=A0A0A8UXQ2_LEGHA|nr:FAD-binding protein [Legionella hackeliae]KTD13165.1 FAD binding domain protein [Legionella hackeliae]CEK11524.1 protein of unknown function [FAD linked oxidase domain protein] [Legionella hackeliae]STX48292.1 FAD binding domain [Legionella hackeliae]
MNKTTIPDVFFEKLQGSGIVVRDPELIARYERNTLDAKAQIGAVYQPSCKEDIQKLVSIAKEHQIVLYPISTGHNWGLGSAILTHKRSIVVELSKFFSQALIKKYLSKLIPLVDLLDISLNYSRGYPTNTIYLYGISFLLMLQQRI